MTNETKNYKEIIKEYLTGDPDEMSWFHRFLCIPYVLPKTLYDRWSQNRGVFFRLDFPPVFRILLVVFLILTWPIWLPCFCCLACGASIYQEWRDFNMNDFEDPEMPPDSNY